MLGSCVGAFLPNGLLGDLGQDGLFSGPVPAGGMTGLNGANPLKPHDILPVEGVKLGVENRSSGVCLASELSPHFLAV